MHITRALYIRSGSYFTQRGPLSGSFIFKDNLDTDLDSKSRIVFVIFQHHSLPMFCAFSGIAFYPIAFKGCAGLVFTLGRWVGSRIKVVRAVSQKLVGTLLGRRCAMSWGDLDLTFDLDILSLTFNILSRLYLESCKV